jgi:hypothetical protein
MSQLQHGSVNPQGNLAKIMNFQNAEANMKGASNAGIQDAAGLEGLHKLLREDAAEITQSTNSGNQGGAQEPTVAQQQLMNEFPDKTPQNYNNQGNPLGMYDNLTRQMRGPQSSFVDGFIMSSLDSRRSIAKIADNTSDGYNMLANTFVLHEKGAKRLKKAKKNPLLGNQTLL